MKLIAKSFGFGKDVDDRFAFEHIPKRMPKKFLWMPRSIDASMQYVAESFDLPLVANAPRS